MLRTVAHLLFLAALGGIACPVAFAQLEGQSYGTDALTSQDRSIRFVVEPTYQLYENDSHELAEWSMPFLMAVPFRDRWQVHVQGSVASVRRGAGEDVRGVTDVQAALTYAREIGESSLIVNTNLNVPTGKEELTPEEFETTTLLSQDIYDFQVPGFGQGFGVSTGATWAIPVGDRIALGLGGSYQVQGGYTPIANMAASYNPGNQILATGGIEYRITRTVALSAKASITLYGTDTVGDTERFDAGPKAATELQLVRQRGHSTLQFTARYEGRGASTRPVVAGGGLNSQVFPDQGLLHGRYATRLTEAVDLTVWASGRAFGATVAHDSETVGVVGGSSTVDLGDRLSVTPRASYTTGTFTGFAGGLSVGWEQ